MLAPWILMWGWLALLDGGRYRTLTERLRGASFETDQTSEGQQTRQRWKIAGTGSVTVDFLIPPSSPTDQGGRLRNIESDFAAVIAPGLTLAFRDRRRVRIDGRTILGEKATREVWVCGPGAFVVLKALAFVGRGENKDAYDLFYLLRNYGRGVSDVVAELRPLFPDESAARALEYLRADFKDSESIGPRRVAEFLYGRTDANTQADAVGFVRQLLDECKA